MRTRVCVALSVLALGLQACASNIERVPVPSNASLVASPAVSGPIRFWGDAPLENQGAIARELATQRRAAGGNPSSTIHYLAISGGASDGAFGAGLLNGWTAAGTRPRFDIVTGISTGALIAPYAFLGPAYDDQVKAMYTEYAASDIYLKRNLFSIAANASVADDSPLVKLIEERVTPELLAAVAAEHRKGRRLLVGTTHLDAQRPVIWNMGVIAERGDPAAVDLFRKIVLASASIPGVFPPVLIPVDYDGKRYDEMHVDGGVTNQVFIFPAQTNVRSLDQKVGRSGGRRLYVIRNGRLNPEFEAVEPQLLKIAGRSISSLIKYQGMGDLNRLYLQSRNNGVDFNLASVPESFTLVEKEPFDREYMRALYDVGFGLGRAGYKWQKQPPSFRNTPPTRSARPAKPQQAALQ
jgi:hypothetical protein